MRKFPRLAGFAADAACGRELAAFFRAEQRALLCAAGRGNRLSPVLPAPAARELAALSESFRALLPRALVLEGARGGTLLILQPADRAVAPDSLAEALAPQGTLPLSLLFYPEPVGAEEAARLLSELSRRTPHGFPLCGGARRADDDAIPLADPARFSAVEEAAEAWSGEALRRALRALFEELAPARLSCRVYSRVFSRLYSIAAARCLTRPGGGDLHRWSGALWASLLAARTAQEVADALLQALGDEFLLGGGTALPQAELAQCLAVFLERRCAAPPRLSDLARKLGFSPAALSQLFLREKGAAPHRYLTARRMEMAKAALLAEPRLEIAEVAARCGYRDDSYFCRVFLRETGRYPTAFRLAAARSQDSRGACE